MIRVTKSLFYKKVVAALKANGNDTPALRKQLREALLQNLSHEPNNIRVYTELALFEGKVADWTAARDIEGRSAKDCVDRIYYWSDTPQGVEFWDNIYTKV